MKIVSLDLPAKIKNSYYKYTPTHISSFEKYIYIANPSPLKNADGYKQDARVFVADLYAQNPFKKASKILQQVAEEISSGITYFIKQMKENEIESAKLLKKIKSSIREKDYSDVDKDYIRWQERQTKQKEYAKGYLEETIKSGFLAEAIQQKKVSKLSHALMKIKKHNHPEKAAAIEKELNSEEAKLKQIQKTAKLNADSCIHTEKIQSYEGIILYYAAKMQEAVDRLKEIKNTIGSMQIENVFKKYELGKFSDYIQK